MSVVCVLALINAGSIFVSNHGRLVFKLKSEGVRGEQNCKIWELSDPLRNVVQARLYYAVLSKPLPL